MRAPQRAPTTRTHRHTYTPHIMREHALTVHTVIRSVCAPMCTRPHTHGHMRMHMHMHAHTHITTRACTRTHTHTHTHTHAHPQCVTCTRTPVCADTITPPSPSSASSQEGTHPNFRPPPGGDTREDLLAAREGGVSGGLESAEPRSQLVKTLWCNRQLPHQKLIQ